MVRHGLSCKLKQPYFSHNYHFSLIKWPTNYITLSPAQDFFLNNLKWTFITWSVRYTSDSQNFGNFSICSSKPDNLSLLLFWLNNGVINKCLCQYLQDLCNSVNYFPNFPCQIPKDHSWVERPILARLGDRSSKRDTGASHEPRDCRQWDKSQAVTANMHPKCVTIHRF